MINQVVLDFDFVVIHTTFLFYSMQFNQSENFFTDDMQGNLYVRLSQYRLQYFGDGWTIWVQEIV